MATVLTPETADAPKFAVGDWAYNNVQGFNARIVSVVWDKSAHGYTGGWRYWMPGLGGLYPYNEKPSEPYMSYVQTGERCYKEDGFVSRD